MVPGRVRATLDARGPDDAIRVAMVGEIEATCRAIAARRGVALAIEPFYESAACPADAGIVGGLSAAVERRQLPVAVMPSGAGHDAMAMAALCPMGMLFVRCKGGISHNPAEDATEADIDVAVAVLLDFVRNVRP